MYLQERRNNTKRNLARVTTKSRVRCRQSLMDGSVDRRRIKVFEEHPTSDLVK